MMNDDLLCSRDLAPKLGAISPWSNDEYRRLKASQQYIMIRDEIGAPWFWKLVGHGGTSTTTLLTRRSS